MPLIANRDKRKKVSITTEILADVDAVIKQYCQWSGVVDIGYFFEEAAKYVLAHDQLWQKHLHELKKDSEFVG
ncbi:hypothetical protein [Legionella saoudiensis]|uniref:hypothetical protein n=1 Tax=Legionella saoudiensis TaxID=1750561 RepID=UPI000730478B|nr:hypothetical protein [Legionella saoudiensis]